MRLITTFEHFCSPSTAGRYYRWWVNPAENNISLHPQTD